MGQDTACDGTTVGTSRKQYSDTKQSKNLTAVSLVRELGEFVSIVVMKISKLPIDH